MHLQQCISLFMGKYQLIQCSTNENISTSALYFLDSLPQGELSSECTSTWVCYLQGLLLHGCTSIDVYVPGELFFECASLNGLYFLGALLMNVSCTQILPYARSCFTPFACWCWNLQWSWFQFHFRSNMNYQFLDNCEYIPKKSLPKYLWLWYQLHHKTKYSVL